MKYFYILCLSAAFLFSGCSKNSPETKRIPVLEVEGKFLYQDDLNKIVPKNANKIDSTEIADRYIKKWVTDVLMYENGKRNLQNKDEIEQQVEDYRKTLVIHQYEQALIEERIKNTISEEELHNFYTAYSPQLALQDNLIKGILLVLPKNAPKIEMARAWVKNPNGKSLENLEKYRLKNAIDFEYFLNKWTNFNEIQKKIPLKIEDTRSFINSNPFTEISDSSRTYMLRITNSVLVGQTEPFEEAREKIKSIMMNKRQSDFIIQFENDIYNDAVKDETINFFKKQ